MIHDSVRIDCHNRSPHTTTASLTLATPIQTLNLPSRRTFALITCQVPFLSPLLPHSPLFPSSPHFPRHGTPTAQKNHPPTTYLRTWLVSTYPTSPPHKQLSRTYTRTTRGVTEPNPRVPPFPFPEHERSSKPFSDVGRVA
ncbi:hypothetical protein COCSADRAFT_268534 [Bipolaris sorokiniana ND90Pr]|uniref:Uncharacterized protein n=1 Tax=Cochliobolus sativus (strain ND90Pr / ATCC 201652) TaxID=665912 RepID=M2TFQ6_COCSN|nr:uncharacterized protein COCSADRAFT_268534 [Bipolaris sorokiniana ND90Pr]EMD68076.1 hypothetical protein COCSADRAFT_268534 [Bipolaris sorokiniana ND90Pr]